MINYGLPQSVEVNGTEYAVYTDYRRILDICDALTDPELTDYERTAVVLTLFYGEDFMQAIPQADMEDAIKAVFWFINCGEEEEKTHHQPKLVDWSQDFQYIIAPVNRVAGQEIRSLEYLHWWTFVSMYNEIGGDCTFAQIVRIRDKLARHKKLDDADKEWLKQNRSKVDFKQRYTDAEKDILEEWLNGGEQRNLNPDQS